MNVHLFIICHKEIDVPSAAHIRQIRSDRTDGIQIARKTNYCELRAQYWVWKNEAFSETDYVGFFHYRRYLDLEKNTITELPAAARPTPYRIARRPSGRLYQRDIYPLIADFDVIAPTWEYTGISVWERYGKSSRQRGKDLKTAYRVIAERHPVFLSAADAYLDGLGEYYGNIYIMKWGRFQEYCAWLFDILEEFDRRAPDAPPFADGLLGERLFGIYMTWLAERENLRCGELPRVHYSIYDDADHHIGRERLVNAVLPPGSKSRAVLRKLKYSQKGV